MVIIGSQRSNSSNLKLVEYLEQLSISELNFNYYNGLNNLPHFNPELDTENPPGEVLELRNQIEQAAGIIICSPEYVFSIPGSLKNALEWCVSTVLFTDKPLGLITASSSGLKAHEDLQLIMRTLGAKFQEENTLLINAVKAKFDYAGKLVDTKTQQQLALFIQTFIKNLEYR